MALGAEHKQPAGLEGYLLEARDLGPDFRRARITLALLRVLDIRKLLADAHVGIAAELNVGAAPSHVGCDGDRAGHPRLPDNIGLLLVIARIKDGEHLGFRGSRIPAVERGKGIGIGEVVLFPALFAQHLRELLRLLDRGRADQHRLAPLLAVLD